MPTRRPHLAAFSSKVILSLSLFLAGCSHNWAPRPGVDAATFERTKAQCSIMARHGGSGFAAAGSVKFVVAAEVGNAIGEAFRAQADFNDCMVASGWQVADKPSEHQAAQLQTVKQQLIDTVTRRKECVNAIRSSGRYDILLPHLGGLSINPYTMSQLANESIPSPAESALMASYADDTDRCIEAWLAAAKPIHPLIAKAYEESWTGSQAVTLLLVKRQITWGEYAQRQQGISQNLTTLLNQIRL